MIREQLPKGQVFVAACCFFGLEGVNNPCAVDTGRDGGSLVNRA